MNQQTAPRGFTQRHEANGPDAPESPFNFTDETDDTDEKKSATEEKREFAAQREAELAYYVRQHVSAKGDDWQPCLFQLARRAVGLERPLGLDEIDMLINDWLLLCPEPRPPRIEALASFRRCVDEVRQPLYARERWIQIITTEAAAMPDPILTAKFFPHEIHLIRICRVLQDMASKRGKHSFFLPCRFAADLMTAGGTPISHTAAADTLKMLTSASAGVLEVMYEGTRYKARRYRLRFST